MSMIFKFRLISDEVDDFVREYEVPYDMNLLDFYNFMNDDLGYEEEMASIFTSDSQWQKLREFTLFDMNLNPEEAPAAIVEPMDTVDLGQIIHKKFERLIYVFDIFEDRCFFIELIESKKREEDIDYPRVTVSDGEPPKQYEAAPKREESIFDEAMGEFEEFEGDETYEEEW